jgi:hypothetical protein
MFSIVPKSWPELIPKERLEPWPRRKGRRMTLIAGFSGRGGTVLCSDLLEVQGGYAKKPVDKITLSVNADEPENIRFQFAIGCSGSGPYMDMLQAELVSGLELLVKSQDTPLDKLPTTIRDVLVDILVQFYGKHIWPRSSSAVNAEMQFLLLIQPCPHGEPCFMRIIETAVSIIEEASYASIGIGSYLAEYILENLHSGGGAKEYQLALAAYVLTEVNENVDGCGHGYSIYHFDENGKMSWMFDKYRPEDFSGLKRIFEWAFQTMTDIVPQVSGFTPQRLGELIDEERLSRLRRLENEIAAKEEFDRLLSDKAVEG